MHVGSDLGTWALGALGLFPTPLLHTFDAPLLAEAILTASEAGIFDLLAEREQGPAELARRAGLEPEATAALLRALARSGYLRERAGVYGLRRVSRRWLVSGSPRSLADKLRFQRAEMRLFSQLGGWLRSGRPAGLHQGLGPEGWGAYQRAMRAFALHSAPQIVPLCPVPPEPREMLDIGGAHGHISAAFCRRYPLLSAQVLDLPEAVRAAAPLLAQEDLGERLAHLPGDATTTELGQRRYDLVFIGQLAHHLSENQNRDLLRRVVGALRPGGIVVIYDAIGEARGGGHGALMDLFGALSSGSRAWSLAEMRGWMGELGLEVLPLRRLKGGTHGILPARR